MRELPILFQGAMVQAQLREVDPKTQTRRMCKNQPYGNGYRFDGHDFLCHNDYLPPSAMLMDCGRGKLRYTTSDIEGWEVDCPYGQPGDQLWVKETFFAFGRWILAYDAKKDRDAWNFIDMTLECGRQYHYPVADPTMIIGAKGRGGDTPMWWKRPAIFMPRAASRIQQELTEVRVERLQDISEADSIAEGIEQDSDGWRDYLMPTTQCCWSPKDSYRTLWDSINGATHPWESNPWVWAVSFRKLKP